MLGTAVHELYASNNKPIGNRSFETRKNAPTWGIIKALASRDLPKRAASKNRAGRLQSLTSTVLSWHHRIILLSPCSTITNATRTRALRWPSTSHGKCILKQTSPFVGGHLSGEAGPCPPWRSFPQSRPLPSSLTADTDNNTTRRAGSKCDAAQDERNDT